MGGSEIREDISASKVEPKLVWACRAGGDAMALQMILTRSFGRPKIRFFPENTTRFLAFFFFLIIFEICTK